MKTIVFLTLCAVTATLAAPLSSEGVTKIEESLTDQNLEENVELQREKKHAFGCKTKIKDKSIHLKTPLSDIEITKTYGYSRSSPSHHHHSGHHPGRSHSHSKTVNADINILNSKLSIRKQKSYEYVSDC